MTDEQKERIRLWVAALRSGEFQQTVGALRIGACHCCLGVACEVYRRESNAGEWDGPRFRVENDTSCSSLPRPVVDWFGLSTSSPKSSDGSYFADMNDTQGASFPTIADAIERTYLTEAP